MDSVELGERRKAADPPTVAATTTARAGAEAETRDDILLDDAGDRIEQHLPPVDGGIAAWRLLWAAFMFEACLWGMQPLLQPRHRGGASRLTHAQASRCRMGSSSSTTRPFQSLPAIATLVSSAPLPLAWATSARQS